MADENRIITFNYAKAMWDSFRTKNFPDSLKTMTKLELTNNFSVEVDSLNTYLNNQLVPRAKFIGKPNNINVGFTKGFQGGDGNGFSDSRFNSNSESEALVTAFGYNKIKGFKIYVNKTYAEKDAIYSAYAQGYEDKYFPVFVNDGNKHLLKKIRIVNPSSTDTEYAPNQGVIYNNNDATKRKASFVVLGTAFSGAMGNRITDVVVPTIGNDDITIDGIYIGITRVDSSKTNVSLKATILVQLLTVGDVILPTSTIYTSYEDYGTNLMGYKVFFGPTVENPTNTLIFGFNKFTTNPGTLTIKINSNPPFSYSTSINSSKTIEIGDIVTITLNASGIGTQTITRTLAIYESGFQIYFDSQLNNLYHTFTVTGNVEIIADLTD